MFQQHCYKADARRSKPASIPWLGDVFFDEDVVVAEALKRLALGTLKHSHEVGFRVDNSHAWTNVLT